MISETTTLPSGAKLAMQTAQWRTVGTLRRSLANQLKAVKLELSSSLVQGFMSVAVSENLAPATKQAALLAVLGVEDVDTVKNMVFQLLGSEGLEDAMFDCMNSCTYNGARITPNTFESEGAREDFYPIVWEVLKLNLRPFFKGLVSTLPTPTIPPSGVPKS